MTTGSILSSIHYADSIRRNRVSLSLMVLILAAVVPLAGNLIWGAAYFTDVQILLGGSVLNLLFFLTAFLINRKFSPAVTKIYPEPGQSVRRVLSWFVLYGAVSVTAFLLAMIIYSQTHLFGYHFNLTHTLWAVFAIGSGSLTAAGLTELIFAFSQWKNDLQELNQMEQRQLQAELDTVKQQVNPHFLFNCLNSLSVLISEAPATAEKFVDEMSKVYRYLLSVYGPDKEDDLVPLEAELRFIRSYIYLLETRYENGIRFVVEVADIYLSGQIAPLSLQVLVDNAVRHNIISPEATLQICIKTTATGQLEVSNNLQRRVVSMSFTEAGLATLISRYKLLFNQAGTIQVKEEPARFTVILPLIYT
ncbi:sensor histidine kinase [Dyadobacter sp. Leaf189]|uniref:sensor histidine kinase n=1 Tax=Dyadobacter sp. Leaf189 TaxID=1736295 RepID=UPI0006F2DE96|nr:histidine kinase [Dyadobacter sp. Leaf189]KQS27655.1 histidine kinase [Dyadobacter sp. Leaf189]